MPLVSLGRASRGRAAGGGAPSARPCTTRRNPRPDSVRPAAATRTREARITRSMLISPNPPARITSVLNPEGYRTSYSYDSASRRAFKYLANGLRASFTYDSANQLLEIGNQGVGTVISDYAYRYDPAGNRTSVKELDGSRVTWLYDKTNQLLGENRTGTSPYRNTFTFDSRGNRTVNNQGGTRTTTTYDVANQIVYSFAAGGRTTYV